MIRRIALVVVAERLGVPLTDVSDVFAALPLDRMPTRHEWQRVSNTWKRALEQRRASIESLERELTGCVGFRMPVDEGVPAAEPDRRAGRGGPRCAARHLTLTSSQLGALRSSG